MGQRNFEEKGVLLLIGEASRRLGIGKETLRVYVVSGKVKAVRAFGGLRRGNVLLFESSEIDRVKQLISKK